MLLVDDIEGSMFTRFVHEQLHEAAVRFAETPLLGNSAAWLRSLPGRRASIQYSQDRRENVLTSPAPENALPDIAVMFNPDIVIALNIEQATWRTIQETCQELHIPTGLYLRDQGGLDHLKSLAGQPVVDDNVLLANSRTLVRAAKTLGKTAHLVPPVIDFAAARVESTRERILLIDPREQHGLKVIDELAPHFRTMEFVLQESCRLSVQERGVVDSLLSEHPNVTFRATTELRADIFSDAAVLLEPHRIDCCPDAILEAMSNGIPVIASDLPGLVESVGPGGIIVSHESEWFEALYRLLQCPSTNSRYQRVARGHAYRQEIRPIHIAETFLMHVSSAVARRRNRPILF